VKDRQRIGATQRGMNMPALGEYSNVYNTAILILQRKGFRVWYDEATDTYCCERDGWDFMANTPTSLLGLVAIFEYKQPATYREYWWREEGPFVYPDLPRTPPDYRPVWRQEAR
jgi:hypothetical protein